MRIISGEFRGRKLLCPRTLHIRPTSDRVRESLFNILGNRCVNARVLDLFAGVGTFGLEAASRGASHVTFVDHAPQSLKYLRKNLGSLTLEFCRERSETIPLDVKQGLKVLAKRKKPLPTNGSPTCGYDVIFLDPPYDQGLVEMTLQKLDEETFPRVASPRVGFPCVGLLNPDFLIIAQHSKRESVADVWRHFQMTDSRKYGDTVISFFKSPRVEGSS